MSGRHFELVAVVTITLLLLVEDFKIQGQFVEGQYWGGYGGG